VNEARARRAGLSNQDIAVGLQTAFSGVQTTQYREGDKIIPVTLRSAAADRTDLGKLDGLNLYSPLTGQTVPLRQVADAELRWEPSKIFRRDRQRTVTVSAKLVPGFTAVDVVEEIRPWLVGEEDSWPLGTRFEFGGEIESSAEANASIGAKLPIALLIIVLLLVGQFNSIRRSLIVLLTIPLGMIGVAVGLFVAQSYFGFMTLLGVISLAGIVINNAIVLLERIDLEREQGGLPPAQAIVVAAQRRLRPILLTTVTTVGGLLPLWLGGGPMFEPMAVAILFGLLFATGLTLGVVPVLYRIFFRIGFRNVQDEEFEHAGS
jgi:multidrug efflux pump subunit AcrB